MKIDFEETLNFMGYVFLGICKTIAVFFIVGLFFALMGYVFSLFGINILSNVGSALVLPMYLLIVSIYGFILNFILYFCRKKPFYNEYFKALLSALSVPISVSIMMHYCSVHLCYI